jgi:hypothetical protein
MGNSAERARANAKKLEMVYIPKHGSWLNMAECELSVLTRVGLQDRVDSIEKLKQHNNAKHSRIGVMKLPQRLIGNVRPLMPVSNSNDFILSLILERTIVTTLRF